MFVFYPIQEEIVLVSRLKNCSMPLNTHFRNSVSLLDQLQVHRLLRWEFLVLLSQCCCPETSEKRSGWWVNTWPRIQTPSLRFPPEHLSPGYCCCHLQTSRLQASSAIHLGGLGGANEIQRNNPLTLDQQLQRALARQEQVESVEKKTKTPTKERASLGPRELPGTETFFHCPHQPLFSMRGQRKFPCSDTVRVPCIGWMPDMKSWIWLSIL